MAKLFSLPAPTQKARGVLIGSGWLRKDGHVSITLNGKIRDAKGVLQDVKETQLIFKTAKDEYTIQLGNFDKDGKWDPTKASLFVQKKQRKRDGVEKDSDFFVRAYPEEK